MTYPRLLNLDEETKAELKTWLRQQIDNHMQERTGYDDQLVQYNQDYWAEPVVKEKTFPFKGACSIIIPLTAIAVEAIHASIMTTMFALPDFVNTRVTDARFMEAEKDYEDYTNHILRNKINLRDKIEPAYLCLEKFGNGIVRTQYTKIVKYGMREVMGEEVEFPVTIYDGADLESVHPSRFMMPFNSQDPQTAPWVGEMRENTHAELEILEQSGLFYEGIAEELKNYLTTAANQDKVEAAQESNENRKPIVPNVKQDWYEIWTDHHTDRSKKKRALQVYFHYDADLLMAVRYNTYEDLRRPYDCGVYIPVEKRWNGIGICKQNDQFQLEVTIQHRQRIDNATIANIRMFKVAKMSGYGPKEPIFPGKMWFLDDMRDIESFQVGEVYPSSYNNEQQAVIYSQQRTGVNELTLGMPQSGTPGTATSDLSRVQESRKKADYILQNVKTFTSRVVRNLIDIEHTYGTRDVNWIQANAPSGLLDALLSQPASDFRNNIILTLAISGQNSNQILDQQNLQQVAGMTTQYWTQMIQLAQSAQNPQLMAQMTQAAMAAATETFKQILTNFNVKNVDRLLFNPQAMNGPQQLLGAGGDPSTATLMQGEGMAPASPPPQ